MSGLTTVAVSRRASEEGEEELAYSSEEDAKPNVASIPVANVHGGGRGYVPGQTPDDPKKKHKCQVCGRGFARAFNLKVSKHLLPIRSRFHELTLFAIVSHPNSQSSPC